MPPQQPRQREQVANNEIHKRPEQAALPRPRQQRAEPSEPSAPREPRTSLRTLRAVLELVCERIPSRYRLDPRTEVMTLVPMRPGSVGVIALNEELDRRVNLGDRS